MDRGTPKDKSVGAALVLTFFFGPFGMLYSVAWWAALLMMVGAFFAALLTFFIFGAGAGVFWAASMVWGAVAASNKHSAYCAWLAAQPQAFVATPPQGLSGGLLAPPAPSQLPPTPTAGGAQSASAQLPPALEAAAQPPAGLESPAPNREEEALLGLKRLSELGLITEQEASAKRAEILSHLFPSSPDAEVTVADAHPEQDDIGLAEETAACDRTAVLPTTTVPIVADGGVTEPLAAVPSEAEAHKAGLRSTTPSRRPWLVAGVVAALIVAVAVAGTLFVLSRHHRPASAPSPAAVVVTPSATPSTPTSLASVRLVSDTLSVNVLPTSQGIDGSTEMYPASVTVRVPSTWAHHVAAYGVAGVVLVAPAGWYGSGGVGADDSASATLHSVAASKIRGQLDYQMEGSGSGGFAAQAAAAYFPWVRDNWAAWGYATSPPVANADLAEHFVSKHLTWYTVTKGPQVKAGFQMNGVARATLSGEFSFDYLQVALPTRDHALSTAILRYYLSPNTTINEGVPQTLNNYYTAINSQDYQTAWQLFSPRFQSTTSQSQFADGLSTVIDSDPVIHYVRLVNSTTAVAYVTFTSFQDASQGPNGDTQDSWTLDYRMKRVGWQWLIDYAGPHNGSAHTSG